ncbi:MAG: nitroreductase family protein [Euzebyales bacterium]|nr:nitroreductase family protein [Euzebyales bacterium]
MQFREVVRRRRITRRYSGEPVEPGALGRVLDAARRGPSAGFSQGQAFIVVTDPERRAGLAALAREAEWVARGFDPWVSSAPVLVVPCAEPDRYRARYAEADKARSAGPDGWGVPYWWVDGGAALMLLLLAAVDEGLAAGFLDVDDRDGVRRLLGIPSSVEPLGLVTLGHPAPDRRSSSLARDRRPLEEVIHADGWQAPP